MFEREEMIVFRFAVAQTIFYFCMCVAVGGGWAPFL